MAAKRIRCSCGKIYDPSEHALCPACGAALTAPNIPITASGSTAVPAAVPAPTTAPPATAPTANAAAPATAPAPNAAPPAPAAGPPPLPSPRVNMRWVWIAGGAVFVLLILIGAVVGAVKLIKPALRNLVVQEDRREFPRGIIDDDSKKPAPVPVPVPAPTPAPAEPKKPNPATADTGGGSKPAPVVKPKPGNAPASAPAKTPAYTGKQWALEGKNGSAEANGKELADTIEKAGEGDTILLRNGSDYLVEGLELKRAIRIVGEKKEGNNLPGALIHTKTQAAVKVSGKGVTLEGLLLLQETTGAAPPPLFLTAGSETVLVDCLITTAGNLALNAMRAASVTATGCEFAVGEGEGDSQSVLLMGEPIEETGLQFKFTKCNFGGGRTGLKLMMAVQGEFNGCKFTGIGLPDGSGAIFQITDPRISVTADQCEFSKNRCGITVARGSLTIKGGAFTENGVVVDEQSKPQALATVLGSGKLSVQGVTFTSNRQGLAADKGGSLEVIDCHFNYHGSKTQNGDFQFLGHALTAMGSAGDLPKSAPPPGGKMRPFHESKSGGQDSDSSGVSSLVVRGTDFLQPNMRVVSVYNGAELTMENCKGSGGAVDSIIVGGNGAPCHATIKKCAMTKFTLGGIAVSGGSSATFEDTELSQNDVGVEVRGAGTQVELKDVSFVGNNVLGIAAYEQAEVTAQGCRFQDNGYGGVQAGLPGKPDKGATVNLVDCMLLNSRTMDVQACAQSRITMKSSSFARGTIPRVMREPTGIVESDHPIEVTASNGPPVQPQPQPQSQPQPAQKQTVINNKPVPRQQPSQQQRVTPPSQPKTVPNKVGDVIDAINKIKQLVR